jgi:hypothetical protein
MKVSLHESRGRGASLVEYSLLLLVTIGGAALMIKTMGLDVRDTFETTSGIVGGGGNESESAGIRIPGGRDGARR